MTNKKSRRHGTKPHLHISLSCHIICLWNNRLYCLLLPILFLRKMMMSGRNYSFILMVIFFSFGRLSHSAPLTTIIPDDETTTEMMSTTETAAPSTAAPPIISLPPLRRNITYVAGPDQLTLLMDKGAFRSVSFILRYHSIWIEFRVAIRLDPLTFK